MVFQVRGDRVKFGKLDLIGNGVSLGGEGEMSLHTNVVQLDFYPVWTKLKDVLAIPGEWPSEVSKRLFRIRVSGPLDGKLDYRSEPVPGVVDPILRIVGAKP